VATSPSEAEETFAERFGAFAGQLEELLQAADACVAAGGNPGRVVEQVVAVKRGEGEGNIVWTILGTMLASGAA
jgi:hypothetical protein